MVTLQVLQVSPLFCTSRSLQFQPNNDNNMLTFYEI